MAGSRLCHFIKLVLIYLKGHGIEGDEDKSRKSDILSEERVTSLF